MSESHPQSATPTNSRERVDSELQRWSRIYAGPEYYYGEDPGPVARRAVRYHRAVARSGGAALDAGCGEGQDLAFLAERGYAATGVEFTAEGAEKARQFLAARDLPGEVLHQDLRTWELTRRYDLVLAVNSVQFLGADAPAALDVLMEATAPGGVIGLSLFAREGNVPTVSGTVYFTTLEELLQRFEGWQMIEAANLWQWGGSGLPQAFVTLIARKIPSPRRLVSLG